MWDTAGRQAGGLEGSKSQETMFLFTNIHKRGFGESPRRLGLILLQLS